VNRCAIIRCDVNARMEGAFAADGSRRSPKLSVIWPSTGQTEGVYEEIGETEDGSKRKPPAEMAIAAAFFLRRYIARRTDRKRLPA